MTPDLAMSMIRDMLWTGGLVAAPVLAVSLFVGLIVSILQVVTQIQEMTLTFVPKILAATAILFLFGSWMINILMAFSINLIKSIPSMF